MQDAAIIAATYETYRHVPSRKVVQIVLEVPAEGQEALFDAIGYPKSNESVWVAVCLLREPEQAAPSAIEHQPEPELPKRKSSAQIAGILCATGSFQKFVGAKSEAEAADYIRGHCNVDSRADIDGNEEAERIFRDIKGDYDVWMTAPDAFAPRETRAA